MIVDQNNQLSVFSQHEDEKQTYSQPERKLINFTLICLFCRKFNNGILPNTNLCDILNDLIRKNSLLKEHYARREHVSLSMERYSIILY
jgi:hypothetical protein